MTSQVPTVHYTPFTIKFESGHQARALRTPKDGDVERIITGLGLRRSPVLFIIGGAANMEDEASSQIRAVIDKGLARFAHEHRITIVDGGTATGVMQVIGNARRQSGYTFPLIGVAPFNKVAFPGHPARERTTLLDNHHSHFVLTDGDHFGDESDMIARLVTAISQKPRFKALGLIVNGGEVARQEASQRASGQWRFPLLVFGGSGRLADEVAEAKRTGQVPVVDERTTQELKEITILAKAETVHLFRISDGPEKLRARFSSYFLGV